MSKPTLDDLEAVRTIVTALGGFEAKDQERVLRWAREKLGLAIPASDRVAHPPAGVSPPVEAQTAGTSETSHIKSFIARKNPSSDAQFAAAVAYYNRFEAPAQLRKDSINADDLQEACRQAGRARLRKPAQTLVHAHNQGLLDRGERGVYTINTVGENLVAMALPAEGKVRAPARLKGRAAAKKRTGKKKAK